VTPEALFHELSTQNVEIVLTAHPTQVNRRTLVYKHNRIAKLLEEKDRTDLTEFEKGQVIEDLIREITALWQTDEIRRRKPTPIDEAKGGLHIIEQSLWTALPKVLRKFSQALKKLTGKDLPISATPITFGSWMGGDRDGNPNVTADVTKQVIFLSRWIAADLYLKEIEILRFELSMSVCSEELSTMVERVQRTSRNAGGQGASPAEGGSPLGGPDAARVVPAAPPGHMTGGESTFSNDASALPPTALPPVRGDDELSELGERISIADHLHVDTGAGAGQGYHGSDNTPPTHTPTGPDGLSPGPQSPVGGATPQTRPSTDQAQLAARAHSNALSLGLDEGQVNALLSAHRRSETMDSEWLASEGSNYVKKYRHLRTMSGLQRNSMDILLDRRPKAGFTPYRTVLGEVRQRLINTRRYYEDLLAGKQPNEEKPIYRRAQEIIDPLMACYRSLWECGGGIVADGRLLDLLRRLHTFDLYLMKMDVRQESTRHTEVLDEVTDYLGIGKYSSWSEDERCEFLAKELQGKRALIPPGMPMSDPVKEAVATFRVCAEYTDSLGAYVISMAHHASDVLAVELLQREARLMLAVERGQTMDHCRSLRVVPLFETLDDLDRAPATLHKLFSLPWYRERLRSIHDDHQEIMLGYSDSGKDAGRLAANWALYRAQENLVKVCTDYGLWCTLFHGRGGTVGRGGGPMMQAVRSQPPGSVNGRLRVTEQGEMVQAKFGLVDVAMRNLEVNTTATMSATLDPPSPPKDEKWRDIMDSLSQWSCEAYREVVFRNPTFIKYFRHATPEEELGNLNIGSRPQRRKKGGGVDTLRAIPWIFAWTQNRMMLPAWLGFPEAMENALKQGWREQLGDMYRHWPFFRTTIDLIEMILAKADMRISRLYDEVLVRDAAELTLGEHLRARFRNCIESLIKLTGHSRLMENNKTLRRLIQMRNPYVDPLNTLQIEILRRLRQDPTSQPLRDALLITINGIAAGMRNTG